VLWRRFCGRTAYSAYGDVQTIRAEKVEVFGSWFPVWNTAQIVKQHPEMVYHSMPAFDLQPIQMQQPFSTPVVPPAVIVNPIHDYRDNLHNICPVKHWAKWAIRPGICLRNRADWAKAGMLGSYGNELQHARFIF
jgi:hypothetical protein